MSFININSPILKSNNSELVKIIVGSNILLHNLYNSTKISISLNLNEITYIKKMVTEHPEIFDKISTKINNMMGKKRICVHDLPEVIIIISSVYNSNIINELINNVDIIKIVQYTIDSILDSNLIPLPEIETCIVKKIVESSINLLRMNMEKKDEICCNLIDNYIKSSLNLDSI